MTMIQWMKTRQVVVLLMTTLLITLSVACDDDDDDILIDNGGIEVLFTECIEDIIAADSTNTTIDTLQTIQRQNIDGEWHFWLNTGAIAYDGDEYIVNEQCDTVCYYAGWIPQECIDNYAFNEWEIVWP